MTDQSNFEVLSRFVLEAETPYEDPLGELEQAIAVIWCGVFNVDRIGRNDNFFSLGGDSLVAMKLVEKLSAELGLDVPVVELFCNPSVRELAGAMRQP